MIEQHLCEVTVPQVTSPEQQSLSTFDEFASAANRHNFGLALLIFHVLFGARHPFSQVPVKRGAGDTPETDNQHFRYAYARYGQSRCIAAPPRAIPVSTVPDAMEGLFHDALIEHGIQAQRPTAQEWVSALASVRGHLKKCSASVIHVYPDHLASCPWCVLEQDGVVYFDDLRTGFTQKSTGFEMAQVWALIQAVPAPPPFSAPSSTCVSVTAQALPAGFPGAGTVNAYRLLAVVIGMVIAVAVPQAFFLGFIAGIVGWFMAGSAGSSERAAEKARRSAIHQTAQRDYDDLVERAHREADPAGFHSRRAQLAKLRDEYQALSQSAKEDLIKLHSTARARRKQQFLETCFIDRAAIPRVGRGRKAVLQSFGIETAADVSRSKVMQVRGFGESLTRAVTDWKATCEKRFVFDASNAVSAAERDQVGAKFGARMASLEAILSRGAGELQNFRQRAADQRATLQPRLEVAARKLAQAKKDLSLP